MTRQRALFNNLDHERAAKVLASMNKAERRGGWPAVVPAAATGGQKVADLLDQMRNQVAAVYDAIA